MRAKIKYIVTICVMLCVALLSTTGVNAEEAIVISASAQEMLAGEAVALHAELEEAPENLEWFWSCDGAGTLTSEGSEAVYVSSLEDGGNDVTFTVTAQTADGTFVETSQECSVTIMIPSFEQDGYSVAKGKTVATAVTGLPEGGEAVSITYSSSDESAVTVNERGEITGVATGKAAVITAYVVFESGNTYEIHTNAMVTNPKFAVSQSNVVKGDTITLEITGTNEYSQYEFSTGYPDYLQVVSDEEHTLLALKNGKNIKVTAVVDGKTITTKVHVSNPHAEDDVFAFTKNGTGQIVLKGVSSKYSTTPVYSVEDESIASVTQTGEITAKKIGSTQINVEVDGKIVPITVTVGKAKAVRAFLEAKKSLGCIYSQTRRMQSGYRDCSSMVWRAYKVTGEKMGATVNWAPTAAAQAYYYTINKKIIFNKAADASKLKVGDLIYFTYKENGRYKNIGHVAMYVGNGYMIHASSSAGKVTYARYEYSMSHVVMIARPVK